jgi:hypothetical protein
MADAAISSAAVAAPGAPAGAVAERPDFQIVPRAVLLGGNLLALARASGFAWRRFFDIARWAAVAYL